MRTEEKKNMASDAAKALEQLAGLMQVRNRPEMSQRLQSRAAEIRYLPELSDNVVHHKELDDAEESKKWSKYGLQLRERDDYVLPTSVEAMLNVADLYASRGNFGEAIRVCERVVEMEEQRCGQFDARLVPLIMRYAKYVEFAGRNHEAAALRLRAAELSQMKLLPPTLVSPLDKTA